MLLLTPSLFSTGVQSVLCYTANLCVRTRPNMNSQGHRMICKRNSRIVELARFYIDIIMCTEYRRLARAHIYYVRFWRPHTSVTMRIVRKDGRMAIDRANTENVCLRCRHCRCTHTTRPPLRTLINMCDSKLCEGITYFLESI